MLGLVKVDKFKAESKDGQIKILKHKHSHNIKERQNIKTNGKTQTNKRIQDIKENLNTKSLLKISTKEILNMLSKMIIAKNIQGKQNMLSKKISIQEKHNTKSRKISTKENLSIKSKKIQDTKENLNTRIKMTNSTKENHSTNNKMITTKNHNKDLWLDQVHLLLSNIQEILQVENHKLLSDMQM